jgi:hypothetical protein
MERGTTAKLDRPRARQRYRYAWVTLAVIVAVLFAIGGLVIVGMLVIFVVGMSHYGSNK